MAAKKKAVTSKAAATKETVAKKKTVKKAAPKEAASGKAVAGKKVTAKKSAPGAVTAKKAAPRKPARKTTSQIGPVPGIAPYKEKKGEEYMNERQVEHFKDILLAWKRGLMEEVDRTVHHMQDDAANFPDPNDRATQCKLPRSE